MDVPTLSYTDTDGQHTVKLEAAATSLGRSPGQNIILLDPFVSRQHAVIVEEGDLFGHGPEQQPRHVSERRAR